MNQTISGWLTQLVPLQQIAQITHQILPAFVLIAVMLLVIGYVIKIVGSEEVTAPTMSIIVLFVCIAGAPWVVTIAQALVNGLVGAIAGVDPQLNWLVVNNPGQGALSLNFSQPFSVIGQYVTGAPGPMPAGGIMDLSKWPDYIMRVIVIGITGIAAAITVAIMEIMLILQAVIMSFSTPLLPVFIACLAIPASKGTGQNFIKFTLGVMAWPVGWAIGHIGTMAALRNLHAPSWNAGLGELVLSLIILGVICLWMVIVTIGAPALIAHTVVSGTNFAAGLVGGFASATGQHAASGIQSGSAVAGALAGSSAGPAGAALGESVGSMAGGAGAALVTSATQAAEGINGETQAVPNSRSAGIADAAIAGIKARAKA
jgi:hypothetical protein